VQKRVWRIFCTRLRAKNHDKQLIPIVRVMVIAEKNIFNKDALVDETKASNINPDYNPGSASLNDSE